MRRREGIGIADTFRVKPDLAAPAHTLEAEFNVPASPFRWDFQSVGVPGRPFILVQFVPTGDVMRGRRSAKALFLPRARDFDKVRVFARIPALAFTHILWIEGKTPFAIQRVNLALQLR